MSDCIVKPKILPCRHCGSTPQILRSSGLAAHACLVLDKEIRMTVDEWNSENVHTHGQSRGGEEMSDNRMTELLRKLLDERGIEYVELQDRFRTRFRFNYCEACDDYYNEIEVMGACITASNSYLTPEQAIAETLGSEREKELESLVRDLWCAITWMHGMSDKKRDELRERVSEFVEVSNDGQPND